MSLEIILVLVVLGASFTQGATGFGFGLLAMSVLPLLVGVRVAVPVVAILGLLVCVTVLLRWRRHVEVREVLPVIAGVLAGTPVGVLFLTSVDARIVTAVLGVILVTYGGGHLIAEARGGAPTDAKDRPRPKGGWGVVAGAFGGLIGGAFNTGGPPIILYATARRWDPGSFQGNLQLAFLISTVFQISLLAARGAVTAEVLRLDLVGLPAMAVGVLAGTLAARRLHAMLFRRIVLVLLVVFGVVFLLRSV